MTEYRTFDERRLVIDAGYDSIFHSEGACEKRSLDKCGDGLKKSPHLWSSRKRESSEPIVLEGCVEEREARKCSLLRGDLECLKGNFWLDDQTLFAYFILITSMNRNIIALDPLTVLIAQNSAQEKFNSYPLGVEKTAIMPLNVNNNHWMLAVFSTENQSVKVYDSLAHKYHYTVTGIGPSVISNLKLVGTFITDLRLTHIEVAGANEVHEQTDGYNCGIYVCLYATRLCSNSITKSEPFLTPAQLTTYRQRIREVLLSFYAVSNPDDEEQIQLPRMINCDGFEEGRLDITFGSTGRNEVVLHSGDSVIDTVKKMRLPTDDDFEILESGEKNPSETLRVQTVMGDVEDECVAIKKGVSRFLKQLISDSLFVICVDDITKVVVNPQLQQLRGVSRYLVILYSNVYNPLAMCIVSRKGRWYGGDVFDDSVKVINKEPRQYFIFIFITCTQWCSETLFSCEENELLSWFWDMALNNEDLFQMIRPLNNMLSVAGIDIKLREFETRCGPVPLVLQGKYQMGICHLNPDEDKKPCFAQLYIASDTKVQNAIDDNMRSWGAKVDISIIERIMSTLKENNLIVRSYMTMFEIYEVAKSRFKEMGMNSVPQVVMNIKQRRNVPKKLTEGSHPRTLNVPVFDSQIASIFLCKDGQMPTHEELDEGIVVYSRGTGAKKEPKKSSKNDKEGNEKGSNVHKNVDSPFDSEISVNIGEKDVECDSEEDFQGEESCEEYVEDEEEENESKTKCGKKSLTRNKQRRQYLSRREFVLYIMARRKNVRRRRFLGKGKLYSQYIIHQYSRIEADRMAAIRRNCFELRSAKASTLYKYTDEKLREKGYKLGKLVTMPSNYVGSRRWCQKQYSKGMAIAQRLGKPNLFLTFTGNSEWPEIKKNLLGKHDSWITDPFLCVRVFYMKLRQFLRDLKEGKIFGEVLACQASVEFQKRGMPHAHILVTLADKFTTAEEVDRCISATTPPFPVKGEKDYNSKKRLHEYVSKFMIHGPCAGREDLACRQRNPKLCEKRFPKQFRDTTEISGDGYPLYKRPDDGRYVAVGRKKQTLASNADVVPYNSWLLTRYNCHINVEICSSLRSYEYIYKYIYKGVDQILLKLLADEQLLKKNTRRDENGDLVVDIDMCEVYLRCRFLPHIEAAYRICGFPLQMSSHKVMFLTPHLEDENLVYFCAGKEVKRALSNKSELLAYFKLCSVDENARNLTWVEVSEKYIYRSTAGVYEKRKKQSDVIGRINSVSPKFTELYALRKMLLTRKGVTSFQNMRTINGRVYRTFMEAAREAGLIEDSNEWDSCLATAACTEMPVVIRRLFAQIVMHCNPPDPLGLWNKYKKEMRTKTKETHSPSDEKVMDAASVKHIEKILRANGSTLSECGLISLEIVLRNLERKYDLEVDELNVRENEVHPGASELSDLNSEQKNVMDVLLESALRDKNDRSRCFFVYGKAGCGKTFLLRRFIEVLQGLKKNVIAVASTGIAATLLQNGHTAHSVFRLPVSNLSFESTANVDASSVLAQRFRDTDVIIWDEISMQTRYAVECAEKILRDVAAPNFRHTAFGGIMMVFGGDWAQFLPVVENGSKTEILNETLKFSGDEDFTGWLREVGEGNNFLIDNLIRNPGNMVMANGQHVVDWLYTPELLNDEKQLANVALLSIRNNDVLSINDIVVEKLNGEYTDVYGVDEAVQEEDGIDGLPFDDEEDIHRETPTGTLPYLLRLKKGCILMLLRNIDITSQLCDGTSLQLHDVVYDDKHVPLILRCRNLITDNVCFIPRTPNVYENKLSGIAFKRLQFPVRLAFCMTVNKSQGQTFEKVGLILRTPAFAHGTIYVALSHSKCRGNTKITTNGNCQRLSSGDILIRNVVYREVL
ncbi:Ulp1 protease family, catalytic domain protein [Ancylostoma duodenale]|uniref:ATP-dependent DNA helicase n=1 Tax=Ancylostoma duodenale TaxID=51022 RepID=A0A0C2GRZ1_9BILA|nr:Ulp1 protease family, catalytic domain protein [Ancylostoma duodenale]